jgi:hypothetical protein
VDWFDGLVVREEGSAEAVAYLSKFAWLLSQGEQLTENPTFQAIRLRQHLPAGTFVVL